MFSAETGWTVVEQRRRPSPLQGAGRSLTRSASVGAAPRRQLERCASGPKAATSQAHAAGTGGAPPKPRQTCTVTAGDRRKGSGYEADPSAKCGHSRERWAAEYEQQQRCAELSMHKRHRRVESTLQVLGSDFDPTEGLAAAAAALAEETLAAKRSWSEQQGSCSSLAHPRCQPSTPSTSRPPSPIRSYAEQRAHVDAMARPKESPDALDCSPDVLILRTPGEQLKRCSELAQPRGGAEPVKRLWRDELASRANALVPDEVAAAQALLAEMRARAEARSAETSGARSSSRPSSAMLRSASASDGRLVRRDSASPAVVASPERDALVADLRAVVEEVLWAVLLQMRCCKNPPKTRGGSSSGTFGSEGCTSSSVGLDDRLGNLLISEVGPTLRPIARRVLAPGAGLARRIRQEFPRLSTHLGFRESDDLEPPVLPWSMPEISTRLSEVRSCRDRLLAMDLTKMVMSQLASR